MSEKEIAEKKVIPHLEELGYPKELISEYEEVRVPVASATGKADIVIWSLDNNDVKVPYLVVEVKKARSSLNNALDQALIYSRCLPSPFFMVTDGEEYLSYQRLSNSWIQIESIPIPVKTHLSVKSSIKGREVKKRKATKESKGKNHHYMFRIKDYWSPVKGWHAGYYDTLSQLYGVFMRPELQELNPLPKLFERDPEDLNKWIELKIADVKKQLPN